MKLRNDFVSNSSSSSFIVLNTERTKNIDLNTFKNIVKTEIDPNFVDVSPKYQFSIVDLSQYDNIEDIENKFNEIGFPLYDDSILVHRGNAFIWYEYKSLHCDMSIIEKFKNICDELSCNYEDEISNEGELYKKFCSENGLFYTEIIKTKKAKFVIVCERNYLDNTIDNIGNNIMKKLSLTKDDIEFVSEM